MLPIITPEGQKAKNSIAEVRQQVNFGATPQQSRATLGDVKKGYIPSQIQPTISADALANPRAPITVPQPILPSIPSNTLNIAKNVSRDTNGFITAQTEEAAKLKELQSTYGSLTNEGSLSDIFKSTQEQYGVTPESFKELKDIQLQLADMDTASGVTKTKIEGASGQTLGTAQAEVTQEDRENAVRTAGKAARASVIQGNIQTATALAKDAVNIAYQDRTLKATNLLNQIEMMKGQVDDQTAQLLEQEKRGYEAELATIKEVKDATSKAIVSGASQEEITQLTDSTIDDATKLALAQSVIARNATQDISLDRQAKEASIRASNASAANSSRRQTEIVDINGVKTLIDSQTGEVISTIKGDGSTTDNLSLAISQGKSENIASILNNSAIGSTVGPSGLARTEPGLWGAAKRFFTGALTGAVAGAGVGAVFGGVGAIPGAIIGGLTTGAVNASRGSMTELTGAKQGFIGSVEQMRSELTLDKLSQAKGAGVTFGALSDGERVLVANSASKLGTWAVHQGGDPNAPVIGYNIDEESFKKEIDTINYYQKLDSIRQGATPESVGAVAQPDGTYWIANSDGTLSQVK